MRKWQVTKVTSSVFSHSAGEQQRQGLKGPRAAMQSALSSSLSSGEEGADTLVAAQVHLTTDGRIGFLRLQFRAETRELRQGDFESFVFRGTKGIWPGEA